MPPRRRQNPLSGGPEGRRCKTADGDCISQVAAVSDSLRTRRGQRRQARSRPVARPSSPKDPAIEAAVGGVVQDPAMIPVVEHATYVCRPAHRLESRMHPAGWGSLLVNAVDAGPALKTMRGEPPPA